MSDYIERNALLDDIHTAEKIAFGILETKLVKGIIEEQPTADVRENVRGKWEVIDYAEPRRYGCSICHIFGWHKTNYCPNCGAFMRQDK